MKISIITATYNSENYIDTCLDSISSQTYEHIEHIIIDGKSSDKTLTKIKKHKFKKSIIISEKDKGIYDALNKGIKHSSGDIIGFLHSDDIFYNEVSLEKVCKEFSKSKNLDAVYGDLLYVKRDNLNKVIRRWISEPFFPHLLRRGWMPPHPTLFIKKKIFETNGYFDESFKISADYLFILKVFSQKKFNSKYIPETLVKMRLGGSSNGSVKQLKSKFLEDWRVLRKNKFSILESIVSLFFKNFLKLFQLL